MRIGIGIGAALALALASASASASVDACPGSVCLTLSTRNRVIRQAADVV
ncbi:hypothetical protein ACH4UM_00440 [Streptomyces sp. NPDC020801]